MSDEKPRESSEGGIGQSASTAGLGAWLPIETAPKDGTAVLGYFPYLRGYFARQDCCPIAWCGWGGGVWQNTTSGHNILGDAPSHWQPLPEAPNANVTGLAPAQEDEKMTNQDKVQSRYPHASAEQESTGEWGVWDINHDERKRLNKKHWPETFGRGLFGLGTTEAEAWADAVQTINVELNGERSESARTQG